MSPTAATRTTDAGSGIIPSASTGLICPRIGAQAIRVNVGKMHAQTGTRFASIQDCVFDRGAEGRSNMDLAPVGLNPKTRAFYVRTLAVLNEAGVPFLVGGAYALAKHAAIERHTKDLDIFVRTDDRDSDPRRARSGRISHRDLVPALAGQGLRRRRIHRRDLQLGQRRRARLTRNGSLTRPKARSSACR